jgi:hypothetical protein
MLIENPETFKFKRDLSLIECDFAAHSLLGSRENVGFERAAIDLHRQIYFGAVGHPSSWQV